MSIDWSLSDFTYPEHVTGLKLKSYYLPGGLDFQQRHPESSRWSYVINMPSGFKAIRFNEHYIDNPESGIFVDTDWFTFEILPNNYELQIRFYVPYQQTSGFYQTRMLSNGGSAIYGVTNVFSVVGTYPVNVSPVSGEIDTNIVMFYCVDTSYYPAVPVEAVTHPNPELHIQGIFGFAGDFVMSGGNNYLNLSDKPGYITANKLFSINVQNFDDWLHNNGDPFEGDIATKDPLPPPVPAGGDDTSEPGGGDGNYDDTSDPIDFPDLPTGGALECGAVIAHRVSKQTIEAIFSKLWSNSIFDPATMWQKSLQNPMDAIVSLHALPLTPEVDGSTNIGIGNFDTELSAPEVTSQYVEIDCGTKNIKEYWGSALDYSPYTRAEIYLPFIGIKDIAVEDIMKSTVHIKYYVDVLTGECIAFIKCGLSVLYHFKGNCKMDIPLSASSMDLIQNTLGAMGHIVSSAAMGAAVGGGAGALAGTVMSAAANVASTKIRTSKSGEMAGSSSLMDDYVPYFILHRPVQSLAKDYNKFKGYPSNITAQLSSLSGYTEVEHINLQNIPNATEEEMNEIKSLLKQGVLL